MNLIKIAFTIITMVVAFVFVFVVPTQSGIEQIIISVLSIAGTYFGIDWRSTYTELKGWLKSKTILGTLIYFIPVILVLLLPVLGLNIPQEVYDVLIYIIGAGGLTFLIGVLDAVRKKSKTTDTL